MKKKKKIITILIALVVVVLIIGITHNNSSDSLATVHYMTVENSTLQNNITTSGVVESTNSKNVFSSLQYVATSVNVEVGDKIKEGDVLCKLNTAQLNQEILATEAKLNQDKLSSDYTLTKNETDYLTLKQAIINGTETGMFNANKQLQNAKITLDNAQKDYDNKIIDVKDNTDFNLQMAENSLQSAQSAINVAQAQLDNLFEWESSSIVEPYEALKGARKQYLEHYTAPYLEKYEESLEKFAVIANNESFYPEFSALMSAYSQYDSAKISYDNALKNLDISVQTLKYNIDSAQIAYDNACIALDNAKMDADNRLQSLEKLLENSQATNDFSAQLCQLENLKKNLEDCTVKSPISGTVTAVNIKEGFMPNGILFTIEDTSSLKINAKVNEYDIGSISENMKVLIKADAIEDEKYEGYISNIAPAAIKDTQNSAYNSNNSTQFEIEVALKTPDTKLLIGMNTNLTIVTEEKENVLIVRCDAIHKDNDGNSIIFIARDNGDTTYTVEEMPVTIGLESDIEVEIIGSNLNDGDLVITENVNLTSGQKINLQNYGG